MVEIPEARLRALQVKAAALEGKLRALKGSELDLENVKVKALEGARNLKGHIDSLFAPPSAAVRFHLMGAYLSHFEAAKTPDQSVAQALADVKTELRDLLQAHKITPIEPRRGTPFGQLDKQIVITGFAEKSAIPDCVERVEEPGFIIHEAGEPRILREAKIVIGVR